MKNEFEDAKNLDQEGLEYMNEEAEESESDHTSGEEELDGQEVGKGLPKLRKDEKSKFILELEKKFKKLRAN